MRLTDFSRTKHYPHHAAPILERWAFGGLPLDVGSWSQRCHRTQLTRHAQPRVVSCVAWLVIASRLVSSQQEVAVRQDRCSRSSTVPTHRGPMRLTPRPWGHTPNSTSSSTLQIKNHNILKIIGFLHFVHLVCFLFVLFGLFEVHRFSCIFIIY